MLKKYWSLMASVAVVLAAFTVHLLVEYGVVDFGTAHNYWFFVCAAIGLSFVLFIRAVQTANRYNYVLIATGLFASAGVTLAASLTTATVHTILLGVAVLCVITFAFAVLISSRNKKDIGKNEQEGYQTYAERKAAEEAQPEEPVELPKLKTFEEVNRKD